MRSSRPDDSKKDKIPVRELINAFRERLHKSKMIVYSSVLAIGVTQIIIREGFPEVHPPWPLIAGVMVVVLFGVILVPPLWRVMRQK